MTERGRLQVDFHRAAAKLAVSARDNFIGLAGQLFQASRAERGKELLAGWERKQTTDRRRWTMVCGLWSMVNQPEDPRPQAEFVERVERNGSQPQLTGGFDGDKQAGKRGHGYSARADLT